jgi:hypothetical protein
MKNIRVFICLLIIVSARLNAQTAETIIKLSDSICANNDVYRMVVVDKDWEHPNGTSILYDNDVELINWKNIVSNGIFENIFILANYNLEGKLIRLDGYEELADRGLVYKWYFDDKSSLVAQLIEEHYFKGKDVFYEKILKRNENWELYQESAGVVTKQSVDNRRIRPKTLEINLFLNSIIYNLNSFGYENVWSNCTASNYTMKDLKLSKYYFESYNPKYKVRGKIFVDPNEKFTDDCIQVQVRFEISGGNLKRNQTVNYQNIDCIDIENFKKAKPNGQMIVPDHFNFDIVDVNFDGNIDLSLYSAQIDCYYIYNSKTNLFEYFPLITGNQIEGMKVDPNKKYLYYVTGEEESSSKKDIYRWENGYFRKQP